MFLKKKNSAPQPSGNSGELPAQSYPDLQNVRALIGPEFPFECIAHHWTIHRQLDLLSLRQAQEIVQVIDQPETLRMMRGFRVDVVVRHRRNSTVFSR